MREHDIAGLIICPARGTRPSELEGLVAGGVPVVLAMRRLAGLRLTSVTPDNMRGARRAVEHLIGLGHRRIAFVGGYEDMIAHGERSGGWRAAMEAAGLPIPQGALVEGAPNRETGERSVAFLLDRPAPFTAALCFNDVVAFGVMDGLSRRGLSAGRDFALVGFDDVREARHTSPPLTTVAVDTLALGERAAHAVLRMIHGDPRVEDYVGDVHLVVRASCGARQEELA
jgi:LacI family transcriptional regulator